MNLNFITNLIATLGIIGLATTLVLPNRQTARVITATGGAGAGLFRAAEGL